MVGIRDFAAIAPVELLPAAGHFEALSTLDSVSPDTTVYMVSVCVRWVASLGASMTRLGITKSTVTQMTRIKPPEGIVVPWLRASWISAGLAGDIARCDSHLPHKSSSGAYPSCSAADTHPK